MTPKKMGYGPDEAPREFIVEAIRQYRSAPDTFKARAPKTAARIREYVNAHPELSRIIQFNAFAGAAPLGIAAASAPPPRPGNALPGNGGGH